MKWFSMDSPLMEFLTKVADLMILNLIFLLCCIPVFTIGASFSAMYYVTLKLVKDEEGSVVKQFFKAFKENFKQASVIWLIIMIAVAILILDYYLLFTGQYSTGIKCAVYAMSFVVLVFFIHVFPYISRFENEITDVFKNTLIIAITHFVKTVFMILIFAVPIALTIVRIEIFPVLILLGFSAPAFVNSVWLSKIYDEMTENYFKTPELDIEISDDTEENNDIDLIGKEQK